MSELLSEIEVEPVYITHPLWCPDMKEEDGSAAAGWYVFEIDAEEDGAIFVGENPEIEPTLADIQALVGVDYVFEGFEGEGD